jgi:hypothetical protein
MYECWSRGRFECPGLRATLVRPGTSQEARSGPAITRGEVYATVHDVGITGQAGSHIGQAAATIIEDVAVAGWIPTRHVNGPAEIAVNRRFGQRPGMWR